jgi:anti-sigma factor RsiW
MSDDHIKSDIPAYLAGGLPDYRIRQIDAHVASCDSCRHALSKVRSKQARAHRQALKSATPDPVPNLFLTRLSKQAGLDHAPRRATWLWMGLVLVIGGVVAMFLHTDLKLARPVPGKLNEPEPAMPASVAASSVPVAVTPQAAAASSATAPAAEPPEEPQPPQSWSGAESGVKDFREVVVRGRGAWRSLWEEMGQAAPAPRLNFYDVAVVGVFTGEKPSGGYQVTLASPQEDNDSVVISYTIAAPPATAAPGVTHPYALMTIPHSTKQIRFTHPE